MEKDKGNNYDFEDFEEKDEFLKCFRVSAYSGFKVSQSMEFFTNKIIERIKNMKTEETNDIGAKKKNDMKINDMEINDLEINDMETNNGNDFNRHRSFSLNKDIHVKGRDYFRGEYKKNCC